MDAELLDIEQPGALVGYLKVTGRVGEGEEPVVRVLAGGVSNRTVLAERPEPEDIATLGEAYLQAMAHSQIVPSSKGYSWAWREREDALDRPLWPIARSAVELLVSGDLRRVKECPGSGDCG